MGHYECGGVRAAMAQNDHGLVENWVTAVKDVARIHHEELNVRGNTKCGLENELSCWCIEYLLWGES